MTETQVHTKIETCVNHPNVETTLHCNRCERPICPQCAVLTPTGYRCKDCVRGQQKTFNTAEWIDYPLAFIIAGGLGFVGSLIASFLGFFTIFIAPIAGVIIAEAVRLAIRKHRSKRLFQVAAVGAALGGLVRLFPILLMVLFSGVGLGSLLSLLWPVLYVVLVVPTVYTRLAGIQMRY